MPPYALFVDAHGHSQFSDLVLEELSHWFDELELHRGGKTTNVVVCFDGRRRALVGNRFYHIGIQGSLEEILTLYPHLGFDLRGFLLEDFDEHVPNDFSFLLGFSYPRELVQEAIGGVDAPEVHVALVAHALQAVLRLVFSQAPVVDHHGMEPVTDGLCHQDGGDGRIDAAAHGTHHVAVSHLFANVLDELLGVVGHDPVLLGPRNLDAEILEDVLPQRGVRDFWMELQTPHALFRVFDRYEFGVVGSGNRRKAFWRLGQFVSV
mmetsp:Transcript_29/g.56  ORF Transcript_29/g.56 Transcript_29/m.56 type:complete len:264 (-) Transcript_29:148-939(-)